MAVATALFSCGQKQESSIVSVVDTADSLGGTFSSNDAKSQIIHNQIKAVTTGDTAYAWNELDENIKVFYPSDTIPDMVGKKAYKADFLANVSFWENPHFTFLRVVTLKMNNGETWTNLWGTWHAKGHFSGKEFTVNVHQAIKWENDKEVQEVNFYDTKFVMDELEAKKAAEKK